MPQDALAQSQVDRQCTRNNIGDVICPSGAGSYGGAASSGLSGGAGGNIFGPGSPLFSNFSSVPGASDLFGQLEGLLGGLPSVLGDVLIIQALSALGGDLGDLNALLDDYQNLQDAFEQMGGLACGNGRQLSGDYLVYAQNSVAHMILQQELPSFDTEDLLEQVCEDVEAATPEPPSGGTGGAPGGTPGGTPGQTPAGGGGSNIAIDTDSEAGRRIAEAAVASIGDSTADNALTQGGSLGCALAVSRILDRAGYDIGEHLATGALYNRLESDPRFQTVDTGHITAEDALGLQPGDILVTTRGERAGHTGVYIGNGLIVSNSSSGFQGSEKGTIQQNYTVEKWFGVTNRNPGGSAVFRYTEA